MLDQPVELVWTRNRSRLITWRSDAEGRLRLRLDEIFDDLEPAELGTLVEMLRSRPGGRDGMKALIERRRARLDERLRRAAPRLPSNGRFHDLRELRDELLEELFPELPAPGIGWSGQPGRARRRIRLGSWDRSAKLVRIHRRLDARDVPRFFVASVVHHELCHAVLDDGRRRRPHGPEFRALERRFPDHERARDWEHRHRARLFRCAEREA